MNRTALDKTTLKRSLKQYLGPLLALLLLLPPAAELVQRLRAPRKVSSETETHDPAPHESVRIPDLGISASPPGHPKDTPTLPGTVLRVNRDNRSQEISLAATPGETAQLLTTLDRSGAARSVRLDRWGDLWLARIDLLPALPAAPGSHRPQAPARGALERVFLDLPSPPRQPERSTETPYREPATAGTFGTVVFSSGERLSWRWNRDTLFLEEIR